MPKFERCKEAHEISLVRAGANPHAHALIRKNRKGTEPSPTPEITDMDAAEIQKAAKTQATAFIVKTMKWDDVTKAFFAGLEGDAAEAFMEKSVDEQMAEAKKAKDALDEKTAKEEAAAKGLTEREAALEKRLAASDARVAELEKRAREQEAESEIEKAAMAPELKGFPGGKEALMPLIKGIKALPAELQDGQMSLLKSQAQFARTTTTVAGMQEQSSILAKSFPVVAEVEGEVTKRMAAKPGQTREATLYEMSQDVVWKSKTAEAAAAADNMAATEA